MFGSARNSATSCSRQHRTRPAALSDICSYFVLIGHRTLATLWRGTQEPMPRSCALSRCAVHIAHFGISSARQLGGKHKMWDKRHCFEKSARRSVSRVLSRPRKRGGDGHSSGTFVAERLTRPTRAAARKARPAAPANAEAACRSYLVLLPVGFSLPPPLPAARCALTAPFHPCRPCRPTSGHGTGLGGMFSVALSLGSPPPGVTRHRASVEPGLSSPRRRASPDGERPSDRLAWDHMGSRTRVSKPVALAASGGSGLRTAGKDPVPRHGAETRPRTRHPREAERIGKCAIGCQQPERRSRRNSDRMPRKRIR